jgi:hypothetical protein
MFKHCIFVNGCNQTGCLSVLIKHDKNPQYPQGRPMAAADLLGRFADRLLPALGGLEG